MARVSILRKINVAVNTTDDVPEWIVDYISNLSVLWWLDHWHIFVKMADKPADSDDTGGCTTVDQAYLNAEITLRRGIDDDQMRRIIMHEMLHVVLGRIDQAIAQVFTMLPNKQAVLAFRLVQDAEEETIQHLVRALILQDAYGKPGPRPTVEPSKESEQS